MDAKKIAELMKWLSISFVGELLSISLLFVLASFLDDSKITDWLLMICGVGFVVFGFMFLINLGRLAARTGRSWIMWVGLTILTNPFGTLVAYGMMKARIANDAMVEARLKELREPNRQSQSTDS